MKEYLDSIGRTIPVTLQAAMTYELREMPDALQLYGYYEWGPSLWKKAPLAIGHGRRFSRKRKGPRNGPRKGAD